MPNEIFAILLGIVAGVLAGMFGIGGGVVIVPALMLFLGFSVSFASGTSLAALLLPVGIFACIEYYRNGYLSIKTSSIIAFGLLVGVFFGAKLSSIIDGQLLKSFYGIFLIYVSWVFIKPLELIKLTKPITQSKELHANDNIMLLLIVGLLAGVLSGLFGIGGGIVITPFLITFMKFNPKKAIGTSLGALLLPVGLPGVIVYYQQQSMDITIASILAAGIVVGAIFGAKITIKLPVNIIKRVYGVFLLIIAIQFIINVL